MSKFQINSFSIIGPRKVNQDSLNYFDTGKTIYACIADGVGGRPCGEVASKISTDVFIDFIKKGHKPSESLIELIQNKIVKSQKENCTGMATTFTCCFIDKDNKLKGVHLGDTKLCVLRGNGIKQLTIEHTEAYRHLVEGYLDFEGYKYYPRNILESALGLETLKIHEFEFKLERGDRIILTSDGLHTIITKIELRDMSKLSLSNEEFIIKVKKLLNSKKLSDNASIVSIEILN